MGQKHNLLSNWYMEYVMDVKPRQSGSRNIFSELKLSYENIDRDLKSYLETINNEDWQKMQQNQLQHVQQAGIQKLNHSSKIYRKLFQLIIQLIHLDYYGVDMMTHIFDRRIGESLYLEKGQLKCVQTFIYEKSCCLVRALRLNTQNIPFFVNQKIP